MSRILNTNKRLEKLRWFLVATMLLIYGGVSGFVPTLPAQLLPAAATSSSSSTADSSLASDDEYWYVFWLMPTKEDADLLKTTIMNDLKDEFDAVSFDPHVTLGPPVRVRDIPDPQRALEIVTLSSTTSRGKQLRGSGHRQIVLTGAHAGYGQLYTQSVFLQLESTPQLDALYQLSVNVGHRKTEHVHPYPIEHFPHMSMLYENCCQEQREAVAEKVQQKLLETRLKNQIAFDAVQLMRIQLPVEGPEGVKKWEVVGTEALH